MNAGCILNHLGATCSRGSRVREVPVRVVTLLEVIDVEPCRERVEPAEKNRAIWVSAFRLRSLPTVNPDGPKKSRKSGFLVVFRWGQTDDIVRDSLAPIAVQRRVGTSPFSRELVRFLLSLPTQPPVPFYCDRVLS